MIILLLVAGVVNSTYRVDGADSKATDGPRTNGHARILRSSLKSTADQSQYAAEDDGLFAPESVPDLAADEAAEHGAEVVDRNDASLLGGVGHDAVGADPHQVNVARGAVDAAHDALVVAFEDQGHGGKEVQCQ